MLGSVPVTGSSIKMRPTALNHPVPDLTSQPVLAIMRSTGETGIASAGQSPTRDSRSRFRQSTDPETVGSLKRIPRMLKVGLYQARYRLCDTGFNYIPPLSLGYLAAYARQRVEGVEFFAERDLERVIEQRPGLVGITYLTHSSRNATREARRLKEALGCPIIGGGPHISTIPKALPQEMDVGVIGEGEATFADLLALYKAERCFKPSSLAKVQGICYRDEQGQVCVTSPRPFIEDLDSIPIPDRAFFGKKWNDPQRVWQVMSSRGCPYDCSFCSVIVQWGHGYRFHSAERVVTELEQICAMGSVHLIHFDDDLFIVKRDRALAIMAAMRERGLHKGREFTCFVRPNLLDENIMESFARTNFTILNVGFESGSDHALKLMNKRAASVEHNRRAVELGRKYGIRFSSCFILGLEGETREDIIQTYQFLQESIDVFHEIQITPLMIFPGTPVWERAAARYGLSENNMRGVEVEEKDFLDGKAFMLNDWPYLNDANIPREEMVGYLRMGEQVTQMVNKTLTGARNSRQPEYVAANVPMRDIVRAKFRRRASQILGRK